MTRHGKIVLAAAALVCSGLQLHIAASDARGEQAPGERGGVLFYAGYDTGVDADYAVGDSKNRAPGGGATINADGLGFRGAALRAGDGEGHVEYSAIDNINPKQGTIEFWMYAQDWDKTDGYFHRFIDVLGEGSMSFELYPDGVMHFLALTDGTEAPDHWEDSGPRRPGITNRAFGSSPLQGKWGWFALTWQEGKTLGCYLGNFDAAGKANTHSNSWPAGPTLTAPQKLVKMLIGDVGRPAGRKARTLIDEIYIYDRALTREEVDWAVANARTRKQGMDIPADFMEANAKVVPDPANRTLVVEIDSGDRSGNFAGTARLEPAAGTAPAPMTVTKGRFGEALIPYTDLPQGDYKVICDITTKDGKPAASVTTKLVVPGPPVWLQAKVGVSDTPPPPWTPVEVEGDSATLWGRTVDLGAHGLPAKIETQGASILAEPIDFRAIVDGAEVIWAAQTRAISSQTAAEVVWQGTSRSALGELSWRTQMEYDGFQLHDLALTPAPGAVVELMELRIPIRKEFAELYCRGSRKRGFLPKGAGEILTADRYWWIGTDDFGLCGATEHNGSLIEGGDGAFSIVREANGDVTVIYRFAAKQTALTEPWQLRLILEATPTKPLRPDWRTWRDVSRPPKMAKTHPVQLCVANVWPNGTVFKHFAFPVVNDPDWMRGYIKDWHDKGTTVLPYAMFAFMAPGMPECDFYWRDWVNPLAVSSLGKGFVKYAAVRPVPSYIDFMVWKNRELIREYGHDGLYIDFAGSCAPALAVEHGLGYERDGTQHQAEFPIVANRKIWKRMYTMLHEEAKDRNPLIVGHTSENSCAPILSFCDVWLCGEGNWFGQLRDDYLEALPLDELRAEFRSQHFGGAPWWLPAWRRAATLEDKDVRHRAKDGKVTMVSVEKTHHMFGIALLLDIGFWPIQGTNHDATKQWYTVQDEFGMSDVAFFGYWDNARLIGGQTDQIKASAYRKPKGGALVVVYNTTRDAVPAKLTVAWDQLKSDGPLEVFDAYTKEPVAVKGNSLTLEVPRLNYRLLWIR